MSRRWILPLAFAVLASAQQAPQKKESKPAKELRIGNYYFKKHNYRAASQRFSEATKWDGTMAEAYLRLGEAKEKQHDRKAAAEAYAKYLEIAPEAKDAPEVKKRMDRL